MSDLRQRLAAIANCLRDFSFSGALIALREGCSVSKGDGQKHAMLDLAPIGSAEPASLPNRAGEASRPAGAHLIAHCILFLDFAVHCLRRVGYIRRLIREEVGFEAMLERLPPVVEPGRSSSAIVPQQWIACCADGFARAFPSLWRRRCLFRSLIILDWAHRNGLCPMLNVGMRLQPGHDRGHCWLSLDNEVFCELGGRHQPNEASFHSGSGVRYWVTVAESSTAETGDRAARWKAEPAS